MVVLQHEPNRRFGELIKNLRILKNQSLRSVALQIGISPTYMEDIEKGRRVPPVGEKLDKIVQYYAHIQDEIDAAMLYETAGSNREELSADMAEYLRRDDGARYAVRIFMKYEDNLNDEVWPHIFKAIEGAIPFKDEIDGK